ncbi:hypothetical protein [Enterobacter hormaechei]|nr:hypothetical protein [Enterobacter hormaechei]MDL5342802.1 hypothetical protein [Enterobacter hormaechei]
MSSNLPLRFSHSHHLLSVKGCDAELDVLAFSVFARNLVHVR